MPDDLLTDFMNEMASGKTKVPVAHRGTDIQIAAHVPYGVPTRIPQLDLSIGRPGYPVGRIIEAYGLPMSGKSTASLSAIASVQRMGGYCVYIDTEASFDPDYAAKNGCDPSTIVIIDADTVEDILRAHDKTLDSMKAVKMDRPFIIVTDSITGVPSQASLDKDYGEEQRVGQDARVIRNGMRKLHNRYANSKALAFFINHAISNISTIAFAKKTSSSGGNAIKYYSSIRLEFARTGNLTTGDGADKMREGMKVKLTTEKNKVNSTGRISVTVNLKDKGFDVHDNLLSALIDIKEVDRVNAQTYLFKPTETQISRKEWPVFVEEQGNGLDEMYKWFLKKGCEKGFLRPYG